MNNNGFQAQPISVVPVQLGSHVSNANAGNIIMPAQSSAAGFRVVSLFALETNSYNQQAFRPYETQLTQSTLNEFQDIYSRNGVNTHYSELGEVAGRILAPSAAARGNVPIINGWGERRLIFVLVVEISRFVGVVQRCVFTGFTDYIGANASGAVDPAMRFYFTNSTQININTDNLGANRFLIPTLVNSSQIVTKNIFGDQRGFNDTFSMRPADVIGSMQAIHLEGETVDYRASVSNYDNPVTLSALSNNNASSYIGKIVNGIRTAINSQESNGGDWMNVLGAAKRFTSDLQVRKHNHMKPLLDHTDFATRKSVTFAELTNLDPNTSNVTKIMLQPRNAQIMFDGSNTQCWDDRSYETVIISRLKHSLPTIMMDNFIAGIDLHISNLGGQWMVAVTGIPTGFVEDLPLDQYVTTFIQRLRFEILPSLLPEGDNFVDIEVNSMVSKDTLFKISYNYGPTIPYLNPTFANNLDAPILTDNKNDLVMLTQDIEHLCVDAGVSEHDYVTGNHHGSL